MPTTYTVKQVADALGFSTNTVYKYLEEGKIKATRLGLEGRFKIPASEVEKLLGKTAPQPVQPAPQDLLQSAPLILADKPANAPELFDWFLALTAIFSAVSELSTPIKNAALASTYPTLFSVAQYSLIFFGGLLFTLDMFSTKKLRLLTLASRIPLAATLGLICYLHFSTGNIWQATYFAVLGIFGAASIVWPLKHFEIKLSVFIFALISITSIGYTKNPLPFIFGDIRYQISNDPTTFITAITVVSFINSIILIFASKRSRVLYPIFTTATGIFFLAITVNYITYGDWAKTIICLFTGCFTLMLPLASQIENFSQYTRKQLVFGFLWILTSIVVGVVGVQITKSATGSLAIKSAKDKAESTAKVADRSISDASLNVIRAASDDRLKTLEINEKTETELLEMSKNIYFTSSLTRRVFFADQDGTTFGIYPPLINSPLNTIAMRDFFQQTKSTRKTIISDVIKPSIPGLPATVYISSPIISAGGEFKGAIAIAIDPGLLHDRLTLMTQMTNSEVVISDTKGNFLFGQDILSKDNAEKQTPVVFNTAQNLVVQTKSQANSLGWNVILVQPYDTVFRESATVSSMVFFICTILGIGSLLVSIHLPHTQKRYV